MSPIWPTKRNCHKMLSIVCRGRLYRKIVYMVYCVLYTGEDVFAGVKILYYGAFFPPSSITVKKVFDNYGCQFAFRASEPEKIGPLIFSISLRYTTFEVFLTNIQYK
jgi:hypothetical protein